MNESITSKGSNQAQKLGKLKQGFIVSSGISGERSVSPLPPPGWRTQTAIGWAHSRTPDPYLTEWSQGICKNWVPIFIKMKRWIYFPNIRIYRVLWTNGPLILISKWWFLNFLFWSNLLYLNVTSWFDLQRRGMIKKTFNHVSNNYTQ